MRLALIAHGRQHLGNPRCCSSTGSFEISVANAWMSAVARAIIAANSGFMGTGGLDAVVMIFSVLLADKVSD